MTSSALEATYPPLPSPSVIQIHDAAPDRLVLSIEPGKGAAGIGLFAIVWNLFMAVFTAMWITAFSQQKGRDGAIYFFLFIGVFWAVGFGFIYAWLKLKFERSLLLVERDRVVLRRVLFGRQRQTEVPLDESSRAQLTESYQQNDSPVYRVTVVGVGGNPLHFGTSLTPAEKDWVVDAINALLLPGLIAPADPGRSFGL
ncbi:MAG: hypothetical protein U0872_14490 [Planctomycetaceae bacterium]